MTNRLSKAMVLLMVVGAAGTAFGEIIDFTGGTAYLWNGGTFVPNNGTYVQGVDYYVEGNFKLDFIEANRNRIFTSIIGDYYGGDNDVIHGHWSTGNYGDLTEIAVTRTDGAEFDLNYFVLTSNTAIGGDGPTGTEQAYIHAWQGGTEIASVQLPPDAWGWSGSNQHVFLGSDFDHITKFTFTVANAVDCFGMDNFYINEPAPNVPLPGAALLGFIGLSYSGWWLRRKVA